MELLKLALDWAKTEVFSSSLFVFFGIVCLVSSSGFWCLGKTTLAKSFIYPAFITGMLLIIIGLGLVFSNTKRIKTFKTEHNKNFKTFLQSEKTRAQKTISEYRRVIKIIPIIVIIASLLIIFMDKDIWRSSSILCICMMTILLLVDSNSKARLENYYKKLLLIEKNHSKIKK